MLEISSNTRVTLHFALRLNETEEVDSNFDGEPATFEVGDGNLIPGFEQAIFGMCAGDREVFRIAPEQGFGPYNEDNIQKLDIDEFDDMELSIGLMVIFSDQAMGEVPGVVLDYDSDWVTVDFNHPLAGKEVWFEVEIIDVEPVNLH